MKKIIDLIKSLLGGGSMAEKAAELTQLETAVVEEVKVVKAKVAEVEAKVGTAVAEVKQKVKKATNKPAAKKAK
jgi:hypothetical protein